MASPSQAPKELGTYQKPLPSNTTSGPSADDGCCNTYQAPLPKGGAASTISEDRLVVQAKLPGGSKPSTGSKKVGSFPPADRSKDATGWDKSKFASDTPMRYKGTQRPS